VKKTRLKVVPQLHRATHQIGLAIGSLAELDVTQAEAIILAFLHEHGRATMSDLHRAFGHRRSTLTNVVDRLVSGGFAKRNVSAADRRSLIVTLSKTGAVVARRVHRLLVALETEALRNTSERDQATLRDVLARLDVDGRRSSRVS
jgi:DNA-binding MarR family transcriptional regulator